MIMITRFLKLVMTLPLIQPRPRSEYGTLFNAIRQVESGGELTPYAVGDNGRSIGPYQISYGYWLDAYRADNSIGGTWAMVVDGNYAEQVILAYWNRHAPKNATWEVLARIHNGGPSGHSKPETQRYWERVVKYL